MAKFTMITVYGLQNYQKMFINLLVVSGTFSNIK